MECNKCNKNIVNILIKKKIKCSNCGTVYISTNFGYIFWILIVFVGLPLKLIFLSKDTTIFVGLPLIVLIFWLVAWVVFNLFADYEIDPDYKGENE